MIISKYIQFFRFIDQTKWHSDTHKFLYNLVIKFLLFEWFNLQKKDDNDDDDDNYNDHDEEEEEEAEDSSQKKSCFILIISRFSTLIFKLFIKICDI